MQELKLKLFKAQYKSVLQHYHLLDIFDKLEISNFDRCTLGHHQSKAKVTLKSKGTSNEKWVKFTPMPQMFKKFRLNVFVSQLQDGKT